MLFSVESSTYTRREYMFIPPTSQHSECAKNLLIPITIVSIIVQRPTYQ